MTKQRQEHCKKKDKKPTFTSLATPPMVDVAEEDDDGDDADDTADDDDDTELQLRQPSRQHRL